MVILGVYLMRVRLGCSLTSSKDVTRNQGSLHEALYFLESLPWAGFFVLVI